MLRQSEDERRTIHQDVIVLTRVEKTWLMRRLVWNAQPEHRGGYFVSAQ